MLFNSLAFIAFLALTLAIYWALGRHSYQNLFLLAASIFFYAVGEPVFVVLLVACALTGYVGGIGIESWPRFRRIILTAACLVCLGILFVFKYFDFFVGSFSALLGLLGFQAHTGTLSLALPIGVSFFTFQAVGYLVDVYRGQTPAEHHPVDFFLFVTFFPQLVAGPIERSTHLLVQVKQPRRISAEDMLYGVFLMAQGYVKKVVIADNLAPSVEVIFRQGQLPGPLVVVGLLAFAFQIYGDFSGYTDIARGVSRLFGFRILLNFDHPYFASSPTDFWRRWHISLSSWFRDYLYIPLGGNRRGTFRTQVNLMTTMLLCGLWHGASFSFVVWGGYHGLLLVLHKAYRRVAEGWSFREHGIYRMLATLATFCLVLYGWLFFRVTDGAVALRHTWALLTDWRSIDLALLVGLQVLPYMLLSPVLDILESRLLAIREERVLVVWRLAPYLAIMGLAVTLFGALQGGDFIYFRF